MAILPILGLDWIPLAGALLDGTVLNGTGLDQLGHVLGNFSRIHCVAICSVLVPLNLGITLTTLFWLYCQRSLRQLTTNAAIATGLALILCLHVSSWFVIGVVTPVTFILFGLALTCLVCNWGAVYGAAVYGDAIARGILSSRSWLNARLAQWWWQADPD